MKKSPNLSIGLVFDDSLDSNDGVAQYVKTLGAWLTAQGHEVTYLCGQTKLKSLDGGEVVSAARNLKIRWGGNNLSIPIWANKAKIKSIFKAKQFDVLHVQVPYSPLMAQRVINQAGPKTAVVGTFHVYPGNKRSRRGAKILKLVYGRSLKRFDKILSVSSAAADFAKQSFGITSSILPNVVEVDRFRTAGLVEYSGRRIVFLGRLVKRKGCLELLKAFNLLCKRSPVYELVIAGDGPMRAKLQTYVKRNGLDSVVSFLGFVAEADKAALLKSADLACFPSLYGESFGIVLVEAMAAGAKVVLGGDNPGYKTVLGEQPLLLINPAQTDAFANRLQKLLSSKPEIDRLHAWQTQTVKQYDINKVGPMLVDLYHEQIARRLKKSNN